MCLYAEDEDVILIRDESRLTTVNKIFSGEHMMGHGELTFFKAVDFCAYMRRMKILSLIRDGGLFDQSISI